MQSCTVIVKDSALDVSDTTFAVKPNAQLAAVPVGFKSKQIVRDVGEIDSLTFSLFNAATSFPVSASGMALFFTVLSKDGAVLCQVKGKTVPDMNSAMYFNLDQLPAGFYSYDLSVKALNYEQQILTGSYVVKN